MDDEDFFMYQHSARMLFLEYMMYNGGFTHREQRYSPSPDSSPIQKRSFLPLECRKKEIQVPPSERFHGIKVNYNELAEKNAQELIEEEERAKLKAEKKKAKKERQKQKKKEINQTNLTNSNNIISTTCNDMDSLTLNSDRDTDGLDLNAAFMSKAVKKVKSASVIPEVPKEKKNVQDINSIINDAVDYEKNNDYKEAIKLISEAIQLAPRRFDLILKRSYLYYGLAQFEKSIQDTLKVLRYLPKNVDAYYRLGEAHFALNNLVEAEAAFTKLLSLNSHYEECNQRLFSIKMKQLENMGYHPNEAFTALLKSKNKTLNEAVDYLTALENGKETTEDLYYSDEDESEEFEEEEEEEEEEEDDDDDDDDDDNDDDEEEEEEESEGARGHLVFTSAKPIITLDNKNKLLTDPTNPLKCCSLFVGCLKKGVTHQEVKNLFNKFGAIKNIRLNAEATRNDCYAFVDYMESAAAGRAMEALQGFCGLLSTKCLIIKYPTKIINDSIKKLKEPELIKKSIAPSSRAPSKPTRVEQPDVEDNLNGSAATGLCPLPDTKECYYWRTTGCVYDSSCFNLHIPAHKGIDLYQ